MNNKIDFSQIDEIQNKADIVSIIGKYIKLSRRGANYFGICPFHADHNPSLVVSPSKKIWKCFVCGSKGNIFTFIQKYKKVSFLEAVKEVAIETGFDVSKLSFINSSKSFLDPAKKKLVEANRFANDLYKSMLFDPRNSQYYEYLKHRGLNDETIKFFEFGYAPKDETLIYNILTNNNNFLGSHVSQEQIWNEKELMDAGLIYLNDEEKPVDFLIDRITIPIYDNNNYVVGFSGRTIGNSSTKYLNTGSSKVFNKGNILFNFNRVRELNAKKVIIVEGFMDAIALYNCGYKNVLATMGVALTAKHLNLLQSLELDTVILCFDNDQAGMFATTENGKKLMSNNFNVYVVDKYQQDIKDVDELMQRNGVEAVKTIIDNTRDFISYLIDLKLNTKLPLDEIQVNINFLLKEMIEYGDPLLRSIHLNLINKFTKIDIKDLQQKLDQLLSKQLPKSYSTYRNFNKPNKASNFDFNDEQLDEIEEENIKIKEILSSVSIKNNINSFYWKLIGLIVFLLQHNDYIEKFNDSNVGFSKYFLNFQEVKILLSLLSLYELNGKVTLEDLQKDIEDRNKEDFKEIFTTIKKDLNIDLQPNPTKLNLQFNELIKNVLSAKTTITESEQLVKFLKSKDKSERDQLLKTLIDTRRAYKKNKSK